MSLESLGQDILLHAPGFISALPFGASYDLRHLRLCGMCPPDCGWFVSSMLSALLAPAGQFFHPRGDGFGEMLRSARSQEFNLDKPSYCYERQYDNGDELDEFLCVVHYRPFRFVFLLL